MSGYLFDDIAERPLTVGISGPFRGVISKAPSSLTDPAAVIATQFQQPTPHGASPIYEFPGAVWEPRVAYARDGAGTATVLLPSLNDACYFVLDDQGTPWILSWFPGVVPAWQKSGPTVAGISPTSGPVGTTVTITGTNFDAGATVTFGVVPSVSVTVVSATEVTATAPTPDAGIPTGGLPQDVAVETAFGTSGFLAADVFTYT